MNKIFNRLNSIMPAEYKKKLKSAYVNTFGHTKYQKLVVIGHARTGSNFLLDALNTSSVIKMYHEIFAGHNREMGKDFERILATLSEKQLKKIKLVGFKLFYYHLTEQEWNQFLAQDEFLIIHLVRKNRLRTIISLDIAFKIKKWSTIKKSEISDSSKNIILDTSQLIQRLEKIENYEELTRRRFKERNFLEISYEDLVSMPSETFSNITSYFGIHDINYKKTKLKKQNPETIQDLIINYNEVAQLLRNTRFEKYLIT